MASPPQQPLQPVRRWVVVPAAGVGARMGADRPKQYLPLLGQTLLEHSLQRLLALPELAGLVLIVHPADHYWSALPVCADPRVSVIHGGAERADSVLNGLNFLAAHAAADDWVLVHDAARPCVLIDSIQALSAQLAEHPVGGILGIPVADTLKAVDDTGGIQGTRDRTGLWQAQTPQMFRYQRLQHSLSLALSTGARITDEASALEHAGYQPLMVPGRTDNIKVTRPEDLALAALILQQQRTQVLP